MGLSTVMIFKLAGLAVTVGVLDGVLEAAEKREWIKPINTVAIIMGVMVNFEYVKQAYDAISVFANFIDR